MALPNGKTDLRVLAFASSTEWEAWLEAQATTSKGVWLKLAKVASGIPSISRQEAINGALCRGWIDGQLDTDYWLVRFTPRRSKGKWSQVNRERALTLIGLGRMRPAGWREIERAKLDGRNRYAILHRIHNAKKPETRTQRIGKYVTMLGRGETIHPTIRPEKRARTALKILPDASAVGRVNGS